MSISKALSEITIDHLQWCISSSFNNEGAIGTATGRRIFPLPFMNPFQTIPEPAYFMIRFGTSSNIDSECFAIAVCPPCFVALARHHVSRSSTMDRPCPMLQECILRSPLYFYLF